MGAERLNRGGDVRHLQLLGRRALGFDDRGGEAAEQEIRALFLDEVRGQVGGALPVRAVVDDLQPHRHPLLADQQAALAHDLGERQLISVANARSGFRLGAGERQ